MRRWQVCSAILDQVNRWCSVVWNGAVGTHVSRLERDQHILLMWLGCRGMDIGQLTTVQGSAESIPGWEFGGQACTGLHSFYPKCASSCYRLMAPFRTHAYCSAKAIASEYQGLPCTIWKNEYLLLKTAFLGAPLANTTLSWNGIVTSMSGPRVVRDSENE